MKGNAMKELESTQQSDKGKEDSRGEGSHPLQMHQITDVGQQDHAKTPVQHVADMARKVLSPEAGSSKQDDQGESEDDFDPDTKLYHIMRDRSDATDNKPYSRPPLPSLEPVGTDASSELNRTEKGEGSKKKVRFGKKVEEYDIDEKPAREVDYNDTPIMKLGKIFRETYEEIDNIHCEIKDLLTKRKDI